MSTSQAEEAQVLTITASIDVNQLGTLSHRQYVTKLTASLHPLLQSRADLLMLFLKYIKDNIQPCYSRDVCLDILEDLVSSHEFISAILCDSNYCDDSNWKHLANALTTLPDLYANCGVLAKFKRLKPDTFYSFILSQVMYAIKQISSATPTERQDTDVGSDPSEGVVVTPTQRLLFLQIISRIAIQAKFNRLVWLVVTRRALYESDAKTRSLLTEILRLPLEATKPSATICDRKQPSSLESTTFQMIIEPLYLPIFFNLKPTRESAKLIKSLLGARILSHDLLEYLICDKSILQAYYNHENLRQHIILFNIFSYLSHLDDIRQNRELDATSANNKSDISKNDTCLLVKTVLEVAKSWSNGTKVLLRSYEQNRYISSALIVGFRHALEFARHHLCKVAEKMRLYLILGTQEYLNRASSEYRNLAISVSETLVPKLDELVDELESRSDKKRDKVEPLKFNIELDSESVHLQKLLNLELEVIFHEYDDGHCGDDVSRSNVDNSLMNMIDNQDTAQTMNVKNGHQLPSRKNEAQQMLTASTIEATLVGVDPAKTTESTSDDHGDDDEEGEDNGQSAGDQHDAAQVPIYLGDCITGLAENNNPRFVKLCLIKAGELISNTISQNQLNSGSIRDCTKSDKIPVKLAQTRTTTTAALPTANSAASAAYTNTTTTTTTTNSTITANTASSWLASSSGVSTSSGDIIERRLTRRKPCKDDALRDRALELAEVLLYLEDQFCIDGFDGLRMRAMSSLCTAMPDIVGKYLLDEFNGSTRRGTRHQLDILLVLVSCAKGLSANKFTKYAALYFYGIVHQLKVDFNAIVLSRSSPSSTITDDSYLLSRIFFSISLIIKCINQQPIVCKLSNDLLDILAAYKNHPDSVVRKSIINCLTVVRNCTPQVYFREYLQAKTANLFGSWLARETEIGFINQ